MRIRARILRDMKKDRVINTYESRGRLIEPRVYNALKARKKCDYCHRPFSGQIPKIHHIIPLIKGGSNEASNLMAVHGHCHEELDAEAGVGEKK